MSQVSGSGSGSHDAEVRLPPSDPDFWLFAGASLGCVLFAGCMSGLTLGLLSIEPEMLDILIEGGEAPEEEVRRAMKIKPLVMRHHHLLVTLLLCNSAAMEALPLCLNKIVVEWVSLLLSVTFVLMFGEIIPQAVCSRYGLAIGAGFSPLVWCLMFISSPITLPLSWVLDAVLPNEESSFKMRRGELKQLIGQHLASHSGALTLGTNSSTMP